MYIPDGILSISGKKRKKKKIFINGSRFLGPRCPSKKIDLGRGVPGRYCFAPK